LIEGKDVAFAWELTPDDVINYLKTLPSENAHCAELAVGALYLALQNFQKFKRDPWKKLYERR